MTWKNAIRQTHRWVSIIFTAVVTAIFIAKGIRTKIPPPVYFLPLLPLALLALTGLYMFFQPYTARRRASHAGT